jgi:hypothetical protein
MARLVIDLQEGFDHVDVEVRVDGDALYERSDVHTNPMTGFADSAEVSVSAGAHEIVVSVGGAVVVRAPVVVDGNSFVGVNIDSGEVIRSNSPFGYS